MTHIAETSLERCTPYSRRITVIVSSGQLRYIVGTFDVAFHSRWMAAFNLAPAHRCIYRLSIWVAVGLDSEDEPNTRCLHGIDEIP